MPKIGKQTEGKTLLRTAKQFVKSLDIITSFNSFWSVNWFGQFYEDYEV